MRAFDFKYVLYTRQCQTIAIGFTIQLQMFGIGGFGFGIIGA